MTGDTHHIRWKAQAQKFPKGLFVRLHLGLNAQKIRQTTNRSSAFGIGSSGLLHDLVVSLSKFTVGCGVLTIVLCKWRFNSQVATKDVVTIIRRGVGWC
mmetsp:Transcript_9209/g.22878  ORF Transcript_9209/g.22878 Transcript_9209/m.22878 type:complete len:99 (+) Transcript_9209:67-363(+)